MIKVNLVPSDILAKAAQRQLVLQATVVGTALLVLLAGVSFGHWFGKYRLDQQLAYDEAELQRLSKIVAQVEELEKQADAVRKRLGVIEDLLKGRAFYPIFMSDFARLVPPGVRVITMNTVSQPGSQLKLTISAAAGANEDIAAWVRSLEGSGKFTAVELGPVTVQNRVNNFSLTALYTNKL